MWNALETAAMSETTKIYTSCTLDCPDGCGIIAHVTDGKVVKLEGHSNHEFTRGYLCAKTYRFPRTLYSEERRLHPLRREGDSIDAPWKRIGWDEALDLIADRIKGFVSESNPLSIMHYQRTGSWGATKKLGHRFWNLLGGVTTASGSLCSGAARAGQKLDFGERLGHDPSDIINSKLVLLWGRNPLATNLHVVPLLKEVRENGGRVVLIDPVKSESATICDAHLQPRVATDAAFAMALAKIIISEELYDTGFVRDHTSGYERFVNLLSQHSLADLSAECGLSIEQLQAFARDYATTKPASILLGWGLNKYVNSAEVFRCVDALAALCGQVGIPGGGVTHGFNTQRNFDKSVEAGDKVRFRREIPEPLLGRGLLDAQDPPVRMMFVNGGNPVNQSPNSNLVAKAFRALDFVVVVDSFLTDTADYAHVFLPTTMFLEEEDVLVSWGHNIIGGVNPTVAPRGETRSDMWIFQQLALRLGFGEDMAGSPREWLKRILAPLESHGVNVDERADGALRESGVSHQFGPIRVHRKNRHRAAFRPSLSAHLRHQFFQEVAAFADAGGRPPQGCLGQGGCRRGERRRHRKRNDRANVRVGGASRRRGDRRPARGHGHGDHARGHMDETRRRREHRDRGYYDELRTNGGVW
jgi:anaerobic selenocysteine-containing dehydrogenase